MKKYFNILLLFLILSLGKNLSAQGTALTLEQCRQQAKDHFPAFRQLPLNEALFDQSKKLLQQAYYPQISLEGQASYQSEVTSLPISIPNIEVPTLSQDQYKIFLSLYQPLTTGPVIRDQKKILTLKKDIQEKRLELSLDEVLHRVDEVYFSLLRVTTQRDILTYQEEVLQSLESQAHTALDNGLLSAMDIYEIQKSIIRLQQNKAEISHLRQSTLDVLSLLVGQKVQPETHFPLPEQPVSSPTLSRKELNIFALNEALMDRQTEALDNAFVPQLGIFAQGGIGRPALNFLSNEVEPYYIGGLKLKWDLAPFYRLKRERERYALKKEWNQIEKEAFILQTESEIATIEAQILRLTEVITSDKKLVELSTKITSSARSQWAEGILSTTDLLQYVNEQYIAQLEMHLHEIEYINSLYSHCTTMGQRNN